MKRNSPSVIFFDLEILVRSNLLPRSAHLAPVDHIDTARTLTKLRHDGVRIGIIGDTADQKTVESMKSALEMAFIYSFLDAELLIYSSVVGRRKDSSEIFKIAVVRAGLSASPEACLFVGESQDERAFASEAGMQALDPDSFWQAVVSCSAAAESRTRSLDPSVE